MRALKLILLGLMLVWPCSAELSAAPKGGRAYYEARGEVIWEVPGEKKLLALTFDDGPDPEDTPKILDMLASFQVKATFFVIGSKASQHPDLLKREMEEGHEIANHTYTHHFFDRRSSAEKIDNEITKTQQVIRDITGKGPKLFRPPGGMFNDAVLRHARKQGLQTIMWSWHQDTKDWSRPGVQFIVKKVLNNVRNGDIILLHDYVSGKSQTIQALEVILPALRKQGYEFVTVSELLSSAGHLVPSMK